MMKPTKAWVGLTERCNSYCTMCNIWKKPACKGEITPEELYRVFSDPFLSEVDGIILSGGEITLRDDIIECVLELHRALPNAGITFSTNGLLPSKALLMIEVILSKAPGINLNVGTSLDYLGPEHDAIRGIRGAYEKVMELFVGLKALREKYPNLGISFGAVLQEKNANHIEDLMAFAERNNFTCLIQWMNRSPFYYNEKSKGLTKEKEREAVMKLPDGFHSQKWMWLDWLDGKGIHFECFALRNFFVLQANGDICPCLTHWDMKIGNIREKPIAEIFDGEDADKVIDYILTGCPGCLNSWGTDWSLQMKPFEKVKYYLKRPREALGRIYGLITT